jgi:hypothetical protein
LERACFVCGVAAVHEHHVVPVSLFVNNATVSLCARCHSLAHGGSRLLKMQSLSERALARRRAAGMQACGSPPFGYRWRGGQVEPDELEQKGLAMLRELHAEGLGQEEIAARLNAEGHHRRQGAAWSRSAVKKQCVPLGLRKAPPPPRDDSLPPCPKCGGPRYWAQHGPGRRFRRCGPCGREQGKRAFHAWRTVRQMKMACNAGE